MKEIFIGSSKEALAHATQVAEVLANTEGVRAVMWTDVFKVGDITFMGIEESRGASRARCSSPRRMMIR